MNTKQKGLVGVLISIIVILSLVSIVSVVYNFLGGFYRSRIIKYNKVLGETQTILVDGIGTFCAACNFSGITLLDNDINQNIYIKTNGLEQDINLRARLFVSGFENKKCELFGYTNWISNDDQYIYFNQKVGANEQIGLCKYVRLNSEIILESNVDYILIFIIEAYLN